MNKEVKLILLDFDGVLVDSLQLAYEITATLSESPLSLDEYLSYFHGNVYKKTARDEQAQTTVSGDHPFFRQYGPKLLNPNPVPGILDLLEYLHINGPAKMAIVTSTVTEPVATWLKKYALDSYFTQIYGADVHKSKIVKMNMALDTYGVEAGEALFVTDTLGDIREANSVGIPAIGVTWGFHPKETLETGEPQHIVDTPEELIRTIKSL